MTLTVDIQSIVVLGVIMTMYVGITASANLVNTIATVLQENLVVMLLENVP